MKRSIDAKLKRLVSTEQPIENLCEHMDALYRKCTAENEFLRRPPNSFTAREYGLQANLSQNAAYKRIRKMIDIGKVKAHRVGDQTFYTFC